MNLGRLHPSDHVTWQGCGKRFQLQKIQKVPPSSRHPASINGTAVHIVADAIHKQGLWDAEREDLAQIYDDAFSWAVLNPVRDEEKGVAIDWGDLQREETARPHFSADAMTMLDAYRKDPRNRDAKLLVSEGTWRATFGGFDWEGTLDQAREMPDGGVELVDLKTGDERMNKTSLQMWPQGFTYALAMRHASFRPLGAGEFAAWTPLSLDVRRITWMHLKDYVPYLKASVRDGVQYKKGDLRGPVSYSIEVTKATLESHLQEIGFFSQAVAAGRFERRPSTYQCSRCKVVDRCLSQFRELVPKGILAGVNPREADYGKGQG